MMGSSSSPYQQLNTTNNNIIIINSLCLKKDHHLKSPLHSSTIIINHRINKPPVDFFNLSISSSSPTPPLLRPLSISSSHTPTPTPTPTQAEVDHQEFLIQDSPNGYTAADTQTVGVRFQLQRECSFGQNFLLTGDHPILGLWDPNNAISLTWSDGHLWTVHLDLPVEKCIKFKFIMQESDGKYLWQPGPDRVLECFPTEKIITLCEDWENPDSRILIETDPTMNQEIQFVEPTQEPEEGYALNMKEVLVSDEGVPVLVPGLSQLPLDEDPKDEPESMNDEGVPVLVPGLSQLSVDEDTEDEPKPMNGAAIMSVMAKDLTLPELDLKGDIANTSISNTRPEISSIHENQESCENKHQEMQVAEEKDHQATQPMRSLFYNIIQWSHNVMQKFLIILGIQ